MFDNHIILFVLLIVTVDLYGRFQEAAVFHNVPPVVRYSVTIPVVDGLRDDVLYLMLTPFPRLHASSC